MSTDASPPPDARRRYHAPIRREQAALTRGRILGAARKLFAERGYVASTVEAIAAQAEVAVPTLYASVGGKGQMLAALVRQLKQEAQVYESVEHLMREPDPQTKIILAAAVTRRFNELAWDVIDVLRAAARAEPELASIWDQVEGARLRDQVAITRRFADEGALRSGLDAGRAADLMWALTAHDQYRLLVVERGWSADEYENWLRQDLCEQLLGTRAP